MKKFFFIPLFSVDLINHSLDIFLTFIKSSLFFPLLWIIILCISGIIYWYIKWIWCLDVKRSLEYLETLISIWALLSMIIFYIAIILFFLVSPQVASVLFHFRKGLKYVSYGGLGCAMLLTLPLLREETLQSYMRKAFLDDDKSLEKPYQRFFIWSIITSGILINLLIDYLFQLTVIFSIGITFSILIVILLSIYWFINQNIFFFLERWRIVL